jgi:soluble lytic murein transglycosylase-like protein
MPAAITNLGLLSGQLTSRPTVEPMFAPEAPAATEDKELAALEAEAKALDEQLGAAKTKTAEAPKVQVGKQDVSIPVGEGYAPPNLVKAIMQVESSFNPKAVSPKGAAGLMQLMPGTARDLGVTDRFDPQQNVDAGSRYLAQQLKKFNSVELTAAAYNWGPRRVANAVAKLEAEGIPVTWENMVKEVKVPVQTKNYVKKVTKLLQA